MTVIKILGLPYTTPVSMRWRWSCCSLWRRSWYWWGYSGGCGGQGSTHRGHGATPSDGGRDRCHEIYVRGSMPWLLSSVRCTWNLIWQHGHSKCSQDIGPFLKKDGDLMSWISRTALSNSCLVNDSFYIVPSTRYINLHFAWSNHLYSDSFLENLTLK